MLEPRIPNNVASLPCHMICHLRFNFRVYCLGSSMSSKMSCRMSHYLVSRFMPMAELFKCFYLLIT